METVENMGSNQSNESVGASENTDITDRINGRDALKAYQLKVRRETERAEHWRQLAETWYQKAIDAQLRVTELTKRLSVLGETCRTDQGGKRCEPFQPSWPHDLY